MIPSIEFKRWGYTSYLSTVIPVWIGHERIIPRWQRSWVLSPLDISLRVTWNCSEWGLTFDKDQNYSVPLLKPIHEMKWQIGNTLSLIDMTMLTNKWWKLGHMDIYVINSRTYYEYCILCLWIYFLPQHCSPSLDLSFTCYSMAAAIMSVFTVRF